VVILSTKFRQYRAKRMQIIRRARDRRLAQVRCDSLDSEPVGWPQSLPENPLVFD
jgi:hypothetical protein